MENSNNSNDSLVPKIIRLMLDENLCQERKNFLINAIEKLNSIGNEKNNPEQIHSFLIELQSAFVIDGIDDLNSLL